MGLNENEYLFDFQLFLHNTKDIEAGFIGLAETNMNWNQPCHICQATLLVRSLYGTSVLQHSNHLQIFLSL